MSTMIKPRPEPAFDAAEMGALAHLYRGEMYRSEVWRMRLDTTTNWAVATTGIAFSIVFSDVNNSPLPLILVGLLVAVFLIIEARRYRYCHTAPRASAPARKRRRTLITVLLQHKTASATSWFVRFWPWLRLLEKQDRRSGIGTGWSVAGANQPSKLRALFCCKFNMSLFAHAAWYSSLGCRCKL